MKVKKRSPRLTRLEKLTKGLSSDSKKYKSRFSVCELEDKGRSLFLLKGTIKKDSFVLEYEGDLITHEEAEMRERTYQLNKEGCYILFFKFQERRWAIDATRRFKSYARYLNHSRQPNIKFHAPIVVDLNGQNVPRIAAYALRDIHEGEEIVFDYGVRDADISWLKNTKTSHMSEIPSDSSDSEKGSEDESSSDGMELSLRKSGITTSSTQRQIPMSLTVSPYVNHPPATQASTKPPVSSDHGMRFFRSFSSSGMRPQYVVRFEKLDNPDRILRIMEEDIPQRTFHSGKSSHGSQSPSIISLSGSDSQSKSSCQEVDSNVLLDSNSQLPRSAEMSSKSKVMEWQCQSSSIYNDVQSDIKILNVESIKASPSDNSSYSPLPFATNKSFIPQISEGSVVSQQCNPSNVMSSSLEKISSLLQSNPINLQHSNTSSLKPLRPSTSYECAEENLSHKTPFEHPWPMSDLLRTCKRLRENSGHIDDLESSGLLSTPKHISINDSLPDEEEFTLISDSEPTKDIVKTEFKDRDEDQIQIILSDSDSDVEITIVENQPKQGISQLADRTFQTYAYSQRVSSSVEYSVPPSAAPPSPVIIIDEKSPASENHIVVQRCMYSSTTPPDVIMEQKSKFDVRHGNSGSFSSSSSATAQSRQTLSSPPVAVIKPFLAHDELNVNEEEKVKLREILGPHLFSDNATSQAVIQTAICKNWSFFRTLTDRGVTIDSIRASVRRFVKAAEKERRKNELEKTSHSSAGDNQNIS